MIIVSGFNEVYSNNEICSNKDDYIPNIYELYDKRFFKKKDKSILYGLKNAERILKFVDNSIDYEKTGIILSNTYGGWSYVEKQLKYLYEDKNLDLINPYVATAWFGTATQGEISISYGLKGYSKTLCAGNFGGALAIKHAFEMLKVGKLKHVISGGVEAPNTNLIRSMIKDKLIDGSTLFFMEDEVHAKQSNREPLFKIIDVKISKGYICDNIIKLAKKYNAYIYNVGNIPFNNPKEMNFLNPVDIKFNLFSLHFPYILGQIFHKYKNTDSYILFNYEYKEYISSFLLYMNKGE